MKKSSLLSEVLIVFFISNFVLIEPIGDYLRHFQWMGNKYPVKQPLRTLSEIMSKLLTQVDTDLRSKSQAYNNLKSNLQNMERKARLGLIYQVFECFFFHTKVCV